MFVLCPHCQFLAALDPATGQPPAHCPRCGQPWKATAVQARQATQVAANEHASAASPPGSPHAEASAAVAPAAPLPASEPATLPPPAPRIETPVGAQTPSENPAPARSRRVGATNAPQPATGDTLPAPAQDGRDAGTLLPTTSPAETGRHVGHAPAAPARAAREERDVADGEAHSSHGGEPANAPEDGVHPSADAAEVIPVQATAVDAAEVIPVQPTAVDTAEVIPVQPTAVGIATIIEDAPTATDAAAPTAPASAVPDSTPATRMRRVPSFAHPARRPAASRPRWPTLATIAGLSLLLALQLLLADRARLSADARWRPLLATLCNALRCDLPAWHQPTAFTLLARDVRPSRKGVLHVSATFRNDARWPQPWPALHLALQDVDGRTVGARTLAPGDYLPGGPRTTQNELAPGQNASIGFDIIEPRATVVAFTFDFR
jgi:hypothetical protein